MVNSLTHLTSLLYLLLPLCQRPSRSLRPPVWSALKSRPFTLASPTAATPQQLKFFNSLGSNTGRHICCGPEMITLNLLCYCRSMGDTERRHPQNPSNRNPSVCAAQFERYVA